MWLSIAMMHVVLTIVDLHIVTTFREVPLEPPGKTGDKIHKGKTQDKPTFWRCC